MENSLAIAVLAGVTFVGFLHLLRFIGDQVCEFIVWPRKVRRIIKG
jgi:hypothetical protein